MKRDNYEHMRDQMRGHFLDYNQEEMIQKFSLKSDESFLYIYFLGKEYRVSRSTGIVEWSDDDFLTCMEGDYNESMTIYDVLCCSKADCCLTGIFMPSSSLKGTVYTRMNAGSGTMFQKSSTIFNQHPDALAKACEALGGIPDGRGDVSYRIPMFDFLPVQFAFWQADEDFPPEMQILWDSNVLSFMHYETLWFAAGHMMRRLEELITVSLLYTPDSDAHNPKSSLPR